MSSAPFLSDLKEFYASYLGSPSKQLNMGWTVTSFFYTAVFFIGVILILAAFVVMLSTKKLREGADSKLPLVIVAYIGIAMILFGVFMTTGNFAKVVDRINASVRADGDCSLFAPDTADSAAKQIASAANKEENTRALVDSLRREQSRAVTSATGGTSGRATAKSLNLGSLLKSKKVEADQAVARAASARAASASAGLGSAGMPGSAGGFGSAGGL
jgi:hypothetical protein